MTIHLPQELVDEIIDHLSGDSDSLTACSLVCRVWVSRTRSCLFETCTLASYNLFRFCDLLQSPGCTFLQHVRRIDASRSYLDPADSLLCLNGLAAGLCRLAHACALEMALSLKEPAVFSAGSLAVLPHITVLTLRRGSPPCSSALLIDIISLCSSLQELHTILGTDTMSPSSTSAMPPPGLRSLKFHATSSPAILTWLNAAGHLPNVDSITLPILQPGEAPTVRAALQQVGCALRHLQVTFHGKSDIDAWTVYDLSLHPNLRTLVINYLSHVSFEEWSHIRLMALITSLVAGPALESLTIYFSATVSTFDWEALEASLSLARFPRLRKVLIECKHNDAQFVRSALPSLEASGVLHIIES
ncbi:hypothetical protein B0H14DRAFT_2474974 [Mycena olivaceomarginata]|nr:hypothetical protein B0H14DRAFT_2474974 [Mycena olivaceomarginata]